MVGTVTTEGASQANQLNTVKNDIDSSLRPLVTPIDYTAYSPFFPPYFPPFFPPFFPPYFPPYFPPFFPPFFPPSFQAVPGCVCCVGTAVSESDCNGEGGSVRIRYGIQYNGTCGASGSSGTGCTGECVGCNCPAFTDWGPWQSTNLGC